MKNEIKLHYNKNWENFNANYGILEILNVMEKQNIIERLINFFSNLIY